VAQWVVALIGATILMVGFAVWAVTHLSVW
jgi:hypothetical protein